MKKVTFTFTGQDSDIMAQEFYNWFVDGGLEDYIVDTLTETGPSKVELDEIDNENLNLYMHCSYQENKK